MKLLPESKQNRRCEIIAITTHVMFMSVKYSSSLALVDKNHVIISLINQNYYHCSKDHPTSKVKIVIIFHP